MLQVANLAIVGRLESDVDSIAATVAVQLTEQHYRFPAHPLE